MTTSQVLSLQRTAGNRAVSALLDRPAAKGRSPGGAQALVVQRQYSVATTKGKSHLRDSANWNAFQGPPIPKGATLLADDDDATLVKHKKTNWRPALNVPPDQPAAVANDRKGYIRAKKVQVTQPFKTDLEAMVLKRLHDAETATPWLANMLATQAHVDFLMLKSIRSDQWLDKRAGQFVPAFETLDAKLNRIKDGADYVAKVLAHWKKWLHPKQPNAVILTEMRLVQSDLHERGLGVIEAKFTKPRGGKNPQYRNETTVHAFIKPEDKSLEQNLLGAGPDSAANKINKIAGLQGKERLRTIKMQSTSADDYGTFVEAAKGVKAESYFANYQMDPKGTIEQSFHETLIFAYLAGIDDLHKKNVYWEQPGGSNTPGIPSLIDADVVMSWSQMNKDQQESSGKGLQSGFSQYNKGEAEKNQEAVQNLDNSKINSKILNVMLTDDVKRRKIIEVLKESVAGHTGRIVPIRTNQWGSRLKDYVGWDPLKRDTELTTWATRGSLVRKGIDFEEEVFSNGAMRKLNQAIGPGLYGTAGENTVTPVYDAAAEKVQTQNDLNMGSIPFYEYEYDTGFVTHNGVHIYSGVSLDQAMDDMLQKFGG
jgi:hypothetical protein